jgi:hypothetical protein
MKDKRGSTNRVPKILYKRYLFEEYHDFFMLLRRVMGLPISTFFED